MEASSKNVQAILFALVGFLAFNTADSFLKNIIHYYDTGFAGLVTILFELAIFLLIARWMGGYKCVYQTPKLKLNILRGVFAATCWLFFILGLKFLDLSVNYSVLLSSSFWVVIAGALLFRQTIGLYRWVATIIGFIGVLIVMQPGTASFQIASLLPLVAAFCFAGAAITARMIGEGEKQSTLVFYIIISNLVILATLTTIQNTWQAIEIAHLPYFFLSAAFYIIGIVLTNKAFTMGDPSAVNPMQYSQIIWGALIGYIFFAETPEKTTLIGAAIIIASGIYLITREHKARQS